jgi:hypothetical protein
VIKLQRINLKKLVKHTAFFLIKPKKIIMIILDMLPLKMVVVVKGVLEVLAVLMGQISQISLRTSLVILVVEAEEVTKEVLAIEVQI